MLRAYLNLTVITLITLVSVILDIAFSLLRWTNHTQEFKLSAIRVMHKRVERGEAYVLVEVNCSCVESCDV